MQSLLKNKTLYNLMLIFLAALLVEGLRWSAAASLQTRGPKVTSQSKERFPENTSRREQRHASRASR